MKRWLAGFLGALLLTGCSSVPFQKTANVSLKERDPLTIVDKFKKSLPRRFQLLNTILYKYGWNKFSTIGYIEINTGTKTFAAAGMNPMGLKLFELTGDKDSVKTLFMMEKFRKNDKFAASAGEDIRRIYFDLVPSADAEIKKGDYRLEFRQRAGTGSIVYIFAGAGGYLTEKKYYEDNKLKWRVSYYEYRRKDGRIYPGGIVLNNYRYGYSLTVKLKEIRS